MHILIFLIETFIIQISTLLTINYQIKKVVYKLIFLNQLIKKAFFFFFLAYSILVKRGSISHGQESHAKGIYYHFICDLGTLLPSSVDTVTKEVLAILSHTCQALPFNYS